jgi:hypothetical protein
MVVQLKPTLPVLLSLDRGPLHARRDRFVWLVRFKQSKTDTTYLNARKRT